MTSMRMPAEWVEHERTLIAWPTRADAWRGHGLDQARRCHAEVIDAVSHFEPVTLVANPDQAEHARKACPAGNVEVVEIPIDDSWLRDSGPIIVTDGEGNRAGIDFSFNGWGGRFTPFDRDQDVSKHVLAHLGIERRASSLVMEGGSLAVDGEGTLLTTEQCLLSESRNPDHSRGEIEQALRDMLGVEQIVWLERGLLEDSDTDGHVDNIAMFLEPGRVLLQTAPAGDPNYALMQRNQEILEAAGLTVETLDLLPRAKRPTGEEVVIPYLNMYFVNGGVIVPVAEVDPDMDQEALNQIRGLIPDREVVGVNALSLAFGGGGIHCITQQVPAA